MSKYNSKDNAEGALLKNESQHCITVAFVHSPLKNTWHFLMNELLLLKKFIM